MVTEVCPFTKTFGSMLFEGQVALSRFKELLNTLKENDKNKINEITFVARDNAHLEGFPLGVVDATVDHVRSVS